jgi:4-hydroxybenzoate polyprenyltransferase/phosphoserine phosphatase
MIPLGQDDLGEGNQKVPLVVDLDGTLIRTDLLVETTFAHLGQNPARLGKLLAALARGKAALKSHIASATPIDVSLLPYDQRVLAMIQTAAASGCPVHLASASNERYVQAISEHLGLSGNCFASSDTENISAATKARHLVQAFGQGGFDYVGNSADDYPVWVAARKRVAVHPSSSVSAKLLALDNGAVILEPPAGVYRAWIKLLRPHQWAKNALVFVPLLTAQRFDLPALGGAALAFLAFSLAASGIYIVNDLVDLDADRNHPSKKSRPLAAGTVPVLEAMIAAPLLLFTALALAALTTPWFPGVLLGYLALTTAYTFVLKRKMIVDVIALAALYTIRVIGGAAAISVPVSEWLLGFSMFIFTALALIKRYVELAARVDADLPDPSNRNYRKSDLTIVAALAAGAAFNAVTLFALYISSETVHRLYRHPKALWLICPILMYWLGRALMMAHRRTMDDDPIVFALKDWNSLAAAVLIGTILIVSM